MNERASLEVALEQVGDRWALLIVDSLLDGPLRFSDLEDRVEGIAPNILSSRLKNLERQGILVARAYSERPPRSVYQLTSQGKALAGAIRMLQSWGSAHAGKAGALTHESCGTPLDAVWFCPTCAAVVESGADDDTRFV